MKTYKLNYFKLLFIILLLNSCGSNIVPNRTRWDAPNFEKTKKNIDEVEKVNTEFADDTISKSRLKNIADNVEQNKNIPPEIIKRVREKVDKIYEGSKQTNKQLQEVRKKLEKTKQKLNPDALSKRSDSLYLIKVKQRKLDSKRISNKIMDEIVSEIRDENNAFIIEINKTVIAINEEQITLVKTLKTYAFMLLTLIENTNFVKNVSLSAEQNNFFETGSYELNESELKTALLDLKNVLISMTANLENLKEKTRIKSNLNAKMIFYIDGYSDSTPFKADSYEKNRMLSQKRADYISNQLRNLCISYFNNYKTEFITFLEPEIIAIGHGEDLPPNLNEYEVEENDPRRRMIKISGFVDIE